MAIQFTQQKKKQQYLILIFGAVLLIIGIVVWYGFFRKEKGVVSQAVIVSPKEVKIDFEFLESSVLKELQPFKEVSPFEKETGRKNPFLPSGGGSEPELEPESES